MRENMIKVGVILEIELKKWRELEHVIVDSSSIVYVKKAPLNVKLKILETKGDLVRENERESSS